MKKRYRYTGPIYHNGRRIQDNSNIFTTAVSEAQARNYFIHKLGGPAYDIVSTYITCDQDDKEDLPKVEPYVRGKCDKCGYQLDDMGECPICDMAKHYISDPLKDLIEELNEIV